MPSLRPRTRLTLLTAALVGLGAARPPALPHQQFTFDAASSVVNYKAQTGTFQNIKIAQGKVTVLADRAHAVGIGRQSSQWTLEGHVRVHAPPHGALNSDTAVVQVRGGRITEVTVTGNPARFTQLGAIPGKIARGHADQIVYDVAAGTVQLNTDAWLSDGRTQMSGPQIGYNILKDRVEASSLGPGKRVHITIAPASKPAHGGGPHATLPHHPGRLP